VRACVHACRAARACACNSKRTVHRCCFWTRGRCCSCAGANLVLRRTRRFSGYRACVRGAAIAFATPSGSLSSGARNTRLNHARVPTDRWTDRQTPPFALFLLFRRERLCVDDDGKTDRLAERSTARRAAEAARRDSGRQETAARGHQGGAQH